MKGLVMNYIISLKTILWISIPLYIIFLFLRTYLVRIKLQKPEVKSRYISNMIYNSTMFIYTILLLGITIFPIFIPPNTHNPFKPSIQLMPFEGWFSSLVPIKYIFLNLVGNLLLLMPLGFLHALRTKKIKVTYILYGFSVTIAIETIQYIEGIINISAHYRSADITDVILNTVGYVLGLFIGYYINRIWKIYDGIINK